MRDDRLYLIHISECIARIEAYVAGGEAAFMSSALIQDAVLRNLQTLAESTQRLSEELRRDNTQVEWRRIAGFRNVLVHDYLGVDVEQVWGIVEQELPALKCNIKSILQGLG